MPLIDNRILLDKMKNVIQVATELKSYLAQINLILPYNLYR